ncbi:hypothetical protein [Actinoplanes sp. RD1]|uniref:hypothetical protein n=1 Tax=Actinoplanes sp. RD1 TaxID=3064538 RepID=UPI002741D17B|nr:hypothetical protein [Actinoplanes sp. RD1]
MSDPGDGMQVPRAVWRRAASTARAVEEEPRQPFCGGDLDTEGRYQLMKERRRLRKEAEAREREEAEAKEAAARKARNQDEDEDKAAERFRNDRYSVKLLQQDNSAWGGGGAGSGDIG